VVSDPEGDKVRLEVEVYSLTKGSRKHIESDLVDSGEEVAIIATFSDDCYRWKARALDEHGLCSEWVEFGDNRTQDPDFCIEVRTVKELVAFVGDGEIALSFTTPEAGADEIKKVIIRREVGEYPQGPDDGDLVCEISAETVPGVRFPYNSLFFYVDKDLANGTTYYYRFFVFDRMGNCDSRLMEGINAIRATPKTLKTTAQDGRNKHWAVLYAGRDNYSKITQLKFGAALGHWWQVPSTNLKTRSLNDGSPLTVWEDMKWLAENVDADDTVIVHFACHGSKGKTYYTPGNQLLDEGHALYSSESCHNPFLYDYQLAFMLKQLPSSTTKIIIIDACFSGGFITELKSVPNIWILTAARHDEYGRVALEHFFTRGLVRALQRRSNADKNGDGLISVREAFNEGYASASNPILDFLYSAKKFLNLSDYTPCHPQIWPLTGDLIVRPQVETKPLVLRVFSPVELTIIDSKGRRLNPSINEIGGSYIIIGDLNFDGDLDAEYVIMDPIGARYKVLIQAKPEVEPDDSFTILWLHHDGSVTVLAENRPINDIPESPLEIDVANNTCAGLGRLQLIFPQEHIKVEFEHIETKGVTTVTLVEIPPFTVPPQFNSVTDFYDLHTTASFSGDVTIRVYYNDAELTEAQEEGLRILRFEPDGTFTDVTTSVDGQNNVVTGSTDSFSYFVVGYWSGAIPAGAIVNHGPNPVPFEGCIFWHNLPDDAVEATLKIFDVDGALLVSIPLDPSVDRYPETGRWIPQDAHGRLLGTGLYLYCVEIKHADGTVTYSPVQKMVIQR